MRFYEYTLYMDRIQENSISFFDEDYEELMELSSELEDCELIRAKINCIIADCYDSKDSIWNLWSNNVSTYQTNLKCPKCGKTLYTSDLDFYTYLCKECDENFFGTEVDVTFFTEDNFLEFYIQTANDVYFRNIEDIGKTIKIINAKNYEFYNYHKETESPNILVVRFRKSPESWKIHYLVLKLMQFGI